MSMTPADPYAPYYDLELLGKLYKKGEWSYSHGLEAARLRRLGIINANTMIPAGLVPKEVAAKIQRESADPGKYTTDIYVGWDPTTTPPKWKVILSSPTGQIVCHTDPKPSEEIGQSLRLSYPDAHIMIEDPWNGLLTIDR